MKNFLISLLEILKQFFLLVVGIFFLLLGMDFTTLAIGFITYSNGEFSFSILLMVAIFAIIALIFYTIAIKVDKSYKNKYGEISHFEVLAATLFLTGIFSMILIVMKNFIPMNYLGV